MASFSPPLLVPRVSFSQSIHHWLSVPCPALPARPGQSLALLLDSCWSTVTSSPDPRRVAAWLGLGFLGLFPNRPVHVCSSSLASGQGFVYCSQNRHSPSSRLGHFLKTLSPWLTVLLSCFRLLCLAQPCLVKWLSQLSFSVLPAQRAHSTASPWPVDFSLCIVFLL